MSKKTYPIIALGGTFDHFHLGHAQLLNFAWKLGEKLYIGITNQELTENKPLAHLIQSFALREKKVKKYCQKYQIDAKVEPLNDIYGPTIDDQPAIQALAVTEDTLPGATKINQVRQTKDLEPLSIHVCPLLRDQQNKIISSERIRAGEINLRGLIYEKVLQTDLELNASQRQFFSRAQGQKVTKPNITNKQQNLICVVGDSSLEQFIKNDWPYDLGVYDKKQQRELVQSQIIDKIQPDFKTTNSAGMISQQLAVDLKKILAIKTKEAIDRSEHLFVKGEEDLVAVALALLTPLETKIYYGQPGEAMIEMSVSLELKNKIYQILSNQR